VSYWWEKAKGLPMQKLLPAVNQRFIRLNKVNCRSFLKGATFFC